MQQVGERAVIVSGMNAAEVGEIIGAYRDSGVLLALLLQLGRRQFADNVMHHSGMRCFA